MLRGSKRTAGTPSGLLVWRGERAQGPPPGQQRVLRLVRGNGDAAWHRAIDGIVQLEGFDRDQQLFGQARQIFHVLRRGAGTPATALR